MFKISLLIIGSEILKGITLDTNSKWITNFITHYGFSVDKIITIDDDPTKIHNAFHDLWLNSNLVLVTGGLGPTKDDLTVDTFASYFKKEIIFNQECQNIVKENFKRCNKVWDKENLYHNIPKDFKAINNPMGLAPSLSYQKGNKYLILLPGVPREVKGIIRETLPSILEKHKTEIHKLVTIQTHGISEEKIFMEKCPKLWDELSNYSKVSCLPTYTGVKIVCTISNLAHEQIIINLFKESNISENIWQYGELSLAEYIVLKASQKKITFSFAESCTGGLAASIITDVAGSSKVFMGSAVTYSNEAKTELLNVKELTIKNHGAVSLEVVNEMSKGSLEKFNTDIAISFSGIAGPGGGTELKPIGTVAISWRTKKNCYEKIYHLRSDRKLLKLRFANIGLMNLLNLIELF